MENTMQFQQNATVLAADDSEIGHITRVVMQPETKVLTHIVVRMGSLLKKEEKLVPIDQIAETTEDRIKLNSPKDYLDTLPLFEEKHYVPSEDGPGASGSSGQVTAIYGSPTGVPTILPSSTEKYVERTEQNIPEGTVAVQEGAKVISSEGKVVGKMERILSEMPDEHQATHLVVSQGFINEEKKLVPIHWVQILGEQEIHLNVDQNSVQELESISDGS